MHGATFEMRFIENTRIILNNFLHELIFIIVLHL